MHYVCNKQSWTLCGMLREGAVNVAQPLPCGTLSFPSQNQPTLPGDRGVDQRFAKGDGCCNVLIRPTTRQRRDRTATLSHLRLKHVRRSGNLHASE